MKRSNRILGIAGVGPVDLGPGQDQATSAKYKLFLRLFLQNERRLYAYIFTLLHNQSDSDDVLQETSLVLWDKFDALNPPNDFAAWACRIAYFKVLDFSKKRQRSRVLFGQALLDHLAETAIEQADALQLDDRREALARCIEKLSARDQELLGWRFAEGGTTRSAAEHIGKRIEAVYKSLARIRHALFECVTRALQSERPA
jgi:RNA polymerase sigma-70 factor (ECF subfamily)